MAVPSMPFAVLCVLLFFTRSCSAG